MINRDELPVPAAKARQILDLPMGSNDADADTIRDYLVAIVAKVWMENEEFSGKYPFGNSDWQYELYKPLVLHGFVGGSLDTDYGHLESADEDAADTLILAAIEHLDQPVERITTIRRTERERVAAYLAQMATYQRKTGMLSDQVSANAFAQAASYCLDESIWNPQ